MNSLATRAARAMGLTGALAAPAVLAGALALAPRPAAAQTFTQTYAIEYRHCSKFLGFTIDCDTYRTDRIDYEFTNRFTGKRIFSETWGTASHCTSLGSEEKCAKSVYAGTDPGWHRVTWGRWGSFTRSYGSWGQGTGQFNQPKGIDISARTGDWHVLWVADSQNNRVVALGVNHVSKETRWLGAITGSESGLPLSDPHDVAWDPAGTLGLSDDRVYIADTGNDRILVYQVNANPSGGTLYFTYLGAFGSKGTAGNQLMHPQGITVKSWGGGSSGYLNSDVYISDTGNQRVVAWYYDSPNTWTAAASPYAARQSQPVSGSEFVGLSLDSNSDLIVSDRTQNRVAKFSASSLAFLTAFGASYYSYFSSPSDAHVVRYYSQDAYGYFINDALPFVSSMEQWGYATGGQLHQLGVDVENLSVSVNEASYPKSASFSFVFTGGGKYTPTIKNVYGTVVRTFATEYPYAGGMRSLYWDGRDNNGNVAGPGNYRLDLVHESNYTYDDGVTRTSSVPFSLGFVVSAGVPGYVGNSGGTYALSGTASQDATAWVWRRQETYHGSGYVTGWYDWDYQQNSSAVIYQDYYEYSIDWQLRATRVSNGEVGIGLGSTYVAGAYGSPNCTGPMICPESRQAPAPLDGQEPEQVQPIRAKQVLGIGIAPAATPRVQAQHFGSGAWIGRATAQGPQVAQLYSLAGKHQARGEEWPNALAAAGEVVQETDPARTGRLQARASFRPLGGDEQQTRYAVRFRAGGGGGVQPQAQGGGFVALALDPDLGARPGDDRLGVDEETGLVWVTDPEAGALGYVLTDLPQGARVNVRQFSLARETYAPDPPTDSAAYAHLAAGENLLAGRETDVRFVLAVGSVNVEREVAVGLVVLRAPSLDALREMAARVSRSGMIERTTGNGQGITRYHLSQATPEPNAPTGVRSVSVAEVPGLAEVRETERTAAAPQLRELVREHGITAVAYAVPDGEAARVQVRIYDARGRLVRRLVDQSHEPGAYRVQWDSADERGVKVAPGVYVAVMEAPGFRATTRMVVTP